MKPGLHSFVGLCLVILSFFITLLTLHVKDQKIQKLQQELDWWKCERQPEQPQPPTLIESN